MIRNDRGTDSLLFTQNDHAHLSGDLAAYLGNARFTGPDPRPEVLEGIELHDAGWPLHDDRPTLNAHGRPLHVFETPVELATTVWRRSADVGTERGPYTGLLVSIHVLNLSGMAARHEFPHDTGGPPVDEEAKQGQRRTDLFRLNQFQQHEIERQERLREQLGLRTDRPVELGLAEPGSAPDEDRLRSNYAWLRLCDLISLYTCIGQPGRWSTVVHPRGGRDGLTLDLALSTPHEMSIQPWPFGVPKIELQIPARRFGKQPFADEAAFQRAYAEAKPESITMRFVPGD